MASPLLILSQAGWALSLCWSCSPQKPQRQHPNYHFLSA